MFESVYQHKGERGLERASRIFYVVAVFDALSLGLAAVMIVAGSPVYSRSQIVFITLAGVLALITGKGIEKQRWWAKWSGYLMAIVLLRDIPIGTVIGIASFVHIFRASRAGLFVPRTRREPH